MARQKLLLSTFILLILSLISSACSDSSMVIGRRKNANSALVSAQLKSGNLLIFEGEVFVASTRPEKNRWQSAGWQISEQFVTGGDELVPANCTLYPHQGVDDQWIGSCSGYTYIPRDGARHIAVMHTQPDGTTKMVQVAPPPVAAEP